VSTLAGAAPTQGLTTQDRMVLDKVERYLQDGLTLKRWWEQTNGTNRDYERFPLGRTFHRPNTSYGFFGKATVRGTDMPVMGNVQEVFYDSPKAPPSLLAKCAAWTGDQIREFVLHYFMRVSSFRRAEGFLGPSPPSQSPFSRPWSWCSDPRPMREGFGFSQLYYKLRDGGQIGKFKDEFAIVDLREIGPKYEWIVVKVKIFDFNLKFVPFGSKGPEIAYGLDEESYLVLSREFVLDESQPSPGLLGRYGLGYAFIKSPSQGLLAYGPGEFDAACELIHFHVGEKGQITVRMTFVVNQPSKILNLQFDPLNWAFGIADLMTMGVSREFLGPLRTAFKEFSLAVPGPDPMYSSIVLLNILSAGYAAERLCISKEQLDKLFLLQHFMQHHETIVGSLLTWRQVDNWLDAASLPEWVVSGRSF